MKISSSSTLKQVAAAISQALQRAGIRAVLTGGACASIYSGGAYESEDLDLILQSAPSRRDLDAAMATVGFVRRHDTYHHPENPFFVEFPRGPLSIGSDLAVKPSSMKINGVRVPLLSATDSCRDRLTAYFHWSDLQSFQTAVAVAVRGRVSLAKMSSWSEQEGASEKFERFAEAVRKARARRQPRERR